MKRVREAVPGPDPNYLSVPMSSLGPLGTEFPSDFLNSSWIHGQSG